MKTLQNKVAIVTGAGSGIGKAIALLFAAEGATVVVSDIISENVAEVVEYIQKEGGIATGYKTDVSREAEVNSLIDSTVASYGAIDILVNNAGIMDSFTSLENVTDELWNKVMGVNLYGTFYGCREAIKYMLQKGTGNIINVASIGGLFGARAGAAYTASKHGVIGLTKNIGYMYATKGIRCNAIAPGGVTTNIMQGIQPDPFGYERMSLGINNNIRAADPSEIADIALFLASDKSTFINGAVITGDGGWTAY